MRTMRIRMAELNTSSVADIAFLLLSFFLMTTVIENDKGLTMTLPEWRPELTESRIQVNERNVFKVQLNSNNELMVEGELQSTASGLKDRIRAFILNNGADPKSSDNPKDAIVSLKADRGTSQQAFIQILDEIQAAYYAIYAERAGLSPERYRALDANNTDQKIIIEKAKAGIPMNISIAEPTKVAN